VDLAPSEDAKRHRTEREQVHAPVDLGTAAECLLRSHVGERTERQTRLGLEATCDVRQASCQPEVEHFQLPRYRQEQVVWLQIAMDDAGVVRSDQHVQHLVEVTEELVDSDGAVLAQELADGLALEQFHHQVPGAVRRRALVEDAQGSFVADLVGERAFAQEAFPHVALVSKLCMQDLDRCCFSVRTGRLVHGADAARTEHLL
jgi:hypothetical protein